MKKIKAGLDNLSAARGNLEGEINLQWDSIKNAVSYIIEFSCQGSLKETKWKILDIISDSRYTVRNLKSNKTYLFRIASADEKGMKQISVNIAKKAP